MRLKTRRAVHIQREVLRRPRVAAVASEYVGRRRYTDAHNGIKVEAGILRHTLAWGIALGVLKCILQRSNLLFLAGSWLWFV